MLWQSGWSLDLVPPIGLPSPLEIVLALWQLVVSGELWIHLEATLPRLGLGWLGGALLGVFAGYAGARWRGAKTVATALVSSIAFVPAIALLPLLIIWLGAGEGAMTTTIGLAAFGPAARAGLADRCGSAIGALRASLALAVAVLVAVEMISGGFGLGALVYSAAELYRSDQIIAGCLVLAAIVAIIRLALRLADRAVAAGGADRPAA